MDDVHAILRLTDDYFTMLYTADCDMVNRLFYPQAQIHSQKDGNTVSVNLEGFQQRMRDRPVPCERGEKQVYRLESLDFAGSACACAKLRSLMLDKLFVDYLTLLKTRDGWKIITKVFHEQPASQEQDLG